MSERDNGGPAFPQTGGVEQLESRLPVQGMTLRDYFAAKAMQALIAKHERVACNSIAEIPYDIPAATSAGAYAYADSMLKERQS